EENVFFFDLKKIVFPLSFTVWKGGEKMVPFGRRTPVLLKKLFADAGISAAERPKYPLIADTSGKRILCAGPLRRSAWAEAGEETEEVLKITFR
ncbi:MAG: tRNA lysidine(34) synthetase TilS, partial [Lentisphaeria bacterium]|nr:tRNA lysidine(34) synthetase TilS [Lentisphaeria bacterium]